MKFRLLGSVEISGNGRTVALPGARQRTLLAFLLINTGRLASKEQLYEELWGCDPPPTAENALQAHVSRLRRTLKEHCGTKETGRMLVTHTAGYAMRVAAGDTDVGVFRETVGRARRARAEDPRRCARLLDEALALWTGAPLHGAVGPVCRGAAVQLEEERLAVVEDRLELSLHLEPSAAISELRRASAIYPWRERVTAMLMLAMYRAGRQAEAVHVYNEARARMIDELGMEPSPVLREQLHRILNQEPRLGPPAAPAPLAG
ncbi:AfsR/SARP family transcriptional regulator [Streptomyces sp. URMC 123]|uniref:AfsR/SARP family transcriptional regulator n=1 Tax=Streptomyces sp. URMC 123 TaxID=3423403 RepID=UPI003F1BC46D